MPFLESQIEKEQRNASESLPAIIACYLSLSGARGLPFIEETYLTQEGPDHEPTFVVEVLIGEKVITTGKGTSRNRAEMQAASRALKMV